MSNAKSVKFWSFFMYVYRCVQLHISRSQSKKNVIDVYTLLLLYHFLYNKVCGCWPGQLSSTIGPAKKKA